MLTLVAILLLATCSQPPPLLEQILASGELRVATRNSPDAYYLGSHGPEGPAYELASRFAENLGVPLRLYTVRTREDAINEVRAGRAHLAAAGLSTGIELPPDTQFGPGYQLVREHLIYRRGGGAPGLDPRGGAGPDRGRSRQPPPAHAARNCGCRDPDLAWIERADTDTEEIMNEVSRGTVQYTLASSTEFALNRAVHPDLAIALDLSPQRSISWVVNTTGHDRSLLDRVNAFFVLSRADGFITALLDRYYGERDRFDFGLSRNFLEHMQSRLPRYIEWFQQAAEKYRLDWRLLASMGYQESKWDPSAVSFTGVRGLMQLTEDTAEMMRYGDRHDPQASIFGGAKYLVEDDGDGAAPHTRARPHVVCRRLVQRRLRPRRGRARARAAAGAQSGPLGRRARDAAAAEPGALVHAHAPRLCARLGAGTLRRQRARPT